MATPGSLIGSVSTIGTGLRLGSIGEARAVFEKTSGMLISVPCPGPGRRALVHLQEPKESGSLLKAGGNGGPSEFPPWIGIQLGRGPGSLGKCPPSRHEAGRRIARHPTPILGVAIGY
jgi:hypothetical protein